MAYIIMKMDQNILAIEKMINKMDKVKNFGLMDQPLKVTIKMD